MTESQLTQELPEPGKTENRWKRHAPFFGITLAGVVVLLVLGGVMLWMNVPEQRVQFVYRPLFATVLSLLALWCVFWASFRGPVRWRYGLPLLFLTYFGIEQLAAPSLSRALKMNTYNALGDPDHHPKHTDKKKGWNSDSLRCPHEAEDFVPEGTNIIFLGDSFTYGMLLKPKQCFPFLVERRLTNRFKKKDIKVANFGWVSSSPLLSARRLESIGEKYSPDLVVLCVDMTDFRDDIRWKAMLERKGMYGVIGSFPIATTAIQRIWPTSIKRLFGWLNPEIPQKRFFMSEQPLEETRPLLADIEQNIGRINDWCNERGVRFAVIVLPRTYQYSDRESPENWEKGEYTVLGPHSLEPFRFFEELSERVDYPIHSLLETFQETDIFPTSFEDDPHWNPEGAKLAASEINRIVTKELAKIDLP